MSENVIEFQEMLGEYSTHSELLSKLEAKVPSYIEQYIELCNQQGPESEEALLAQISLAETIHLAMIRLEDLHKKERPEDRDQRAFAGRAFMAERLALCTDWALELHGKQENQTLSWDYRYYVSYYKEMFQLGKADALNYVLLRYITGSMWEMKPHTEWNKQDRNLWRNHFNAMFQYYESFYKKNSQSENELISRYARLNYARGLLRTAIFFKYCEAYFEPKLDDKFYYYQAALNNTTVGIDLLDRKDLDDPEFLIVYDMLLNQKGMVLRKMYESIPQMNSEELHCARISEIFDDVILSGNPLAFLEVLTTDAFSTAVNSLEDLYEKASDEHVDRVERYLANALANSNAWHEDLADIALAGTDREDKDRFNKDLEIARINYAKAVEYLEKKAKLTDPVSTRTQARLDRMRMKFELVELLSGKKKIKRKRGDRQVTPDSDKYIELWETIFNQLNDLTNVAQKIKKNWVDRWQQFGFNAGLSTSSKEVL
ncbi:hypothetical protein JW887_02210 [Candidatus Dojkabacteria bacterium]|nr:hypothetical protein [Candidatus Dojkabacteria bacterium]